LRFSQNCRMSQYLHKYGKMQHMAGLDINHDNRDSASSCNDISAPGQYSQRQYSQRQYNHPPSGAGPRVTICKSDWTSNRSPVNLTAHPTQMCRPRVIYASLLGESMSLSRPPRGDAEHRMLRINIASSPARN